MATKDDRPGLLSKVAKFVRNPTKDWSELDHPEQPQESGYDKQALKAMIERKRQNDFVRKREFEQLRKLRNRDPSAIANMARPSFFQSSMATDPDGRAVTLKKIDEIEAQMSKQWWKGKQDLPPMEVNAAVPAQMDGHDSMRSQLPTQGPSFGPEHFAPTEAVGLTRIPDPGFAEFAATQMASGAAAQFASPVNSQFGKVAAYSDAAADPAFSTSELFAMDVDDMSTDPELEEAAIRFANGDDAGAEKGLLEALRGEVLLPDVAVSWTAALLDLYRATNNRPQFDQAVLEFSQRLDKATPVWFALQDLVSDGVPESSANVSGDGNGDGVIWECPAVLNLQGMESLRDVLSYRPTPWHVGWSQLNAIAADALPLLDGLFSSLCDEPVTLRFTGGVKLLESLQAMTPSGDRGVSQDWWHVRLTALRAMHLQDEFELAALDYCVTFEVSPPAWQEPRCKFETSSASVDAADVRRAERAGPLTLPMGTDPGASQTVHLRGEVLGDATRALASLESDTPAGGPIVVSCRALIRVDFSAAGSILNWVALRQAEGSHVQFRDVHRLVAAFFNVIGINEHAKVAPRTI